MAAPIVTEPPPLSTDEDNDLVINGFSVADADGGVLTVTLTSDSTLGLVLTGDGGVTIATPTDTSTLTLSQTTGLTFITGDGSGDQTMTFSGTIADINAALAGMTYHPSANFYGAGGFSYTVTDGTTAVSHSVDITVNADQDAPIANDDDMTEELGPFEEAPHFLDVLANDIDVDDLEPPHNDGLTVVAVGAADHGTVFVNNGGFDVTYTSDLNFFGTDSFTYTMEDANGAQSSATVVLTVKDVPDAPIANDDSVTVAEDSGATTLISLPDNDEDPDDIDPDDIGIQDTPTIVEVGAAANGTVTLGSFAEVEYTPNANFYGTDTFTYTLRDKYGLEATATVTVTVTPDAGDAPIGNDDSATVAEDSAATVIDVLANDTDPDNLASPLNAGLTVTAVGAAANGTAALVGGQVQYTPNANFYGTDTFTYTVDDGTDEVSGSVEITVSAVNDAATITGDAAGDVTEAGGVNNGTAGTPTDTGNLGADDIDNPDDAWTMVAAGTGTLGGYGTYAVTAAGVWTYTLDDADPAVQALNGAATLEDTFSAVTEDGTTQLVTITIHAQNDAAVAQNDDFAIAEDDILNGVASVFADNGSGVDKDPDVGVFVVTEVNGNGASVGTQIALASGALVTLNADGTFSYDPNGAFDALPGAASGATNLTDTDTFSYTVTGGDTATVTVTVSGLDSNGDVLQGTPSADTLNGGIGTDTLLGVAGNDTYVLANGADIVTDTAGIDTITSTITRSLASFTTVENLTLLGTAAINGTGNALANTITGNTVDNILNGGTGADTLVGRAGNDTYVLGAESDAVNDTGGVDTITSTITRSLASFATIENLTLLGTAAINGTGNTLANTLTGNTAANRLFGMNGNDKLIGGSGNDVLTGGLNRDAMTGSTGLDDFDFNTVAEIGKGATRDVIKDFVHLSDDIDLSTIDANGGAAGNTAFTFRATEGASFTGARGQVRWFQSNVAGTTNDKTLIEGDINGDSIADFQIELTGLKTLTAADFFL